MKLPKDVKPSNNVEVDCLGERANLNTEAGSALLACQDEVTKLRQQMVAKGSTPQEKLKNEQIFYGAIGIYLEEKDIHSGPPTFMQRFMGGGLNLDVAKDFARKLPNLADRYVLRTMITDAVEDAVTHQPQKTTTPKKDQSRAR